MCPLHISDECTGHPWRSGRFARNCHHWSSADMPFTAAAELRLRSLHHLLTRLQQHRWGTRPLQQILSGKFTQTTLLSVLPFPVCPLICRLCAPCFKGSMECFLGLKIFLPFFTCNLACGPAHQHSPFCNS